MQEQCKYQAAIYVRLSKEDVEAGNLEKEESNSITNQKQLILDYLKDHPEINIVSTRVDDGYTGTNYDRPAFQLMMEDIKAGRINCVVVKDLSRFGREYINAGKYIDRLFPYLGVRLIAINDQIDTITRSPSDDFNIMLKNLMNDNYCRDISVKIRSQFAVKRKNGEYTGSFTPYGYQKCEDDHNKLEIDPYAAGVVQDIFRWKIEGYSQAAIAKKLMETGILAPSEYKRSQGIRFKSGFQKKSRVQWTPVAIRRILTNPVYTGKLIQGIRTTPNYKIKTIVEAAPENWVVVDEAIEAIISPKTFALVQRILKMDTRTAPKEDMVFPLAGMIVCGDCGSPMVRKTTVSGKKKYIYYTCISSKEKGVCSSHLIPEQQLMDSVLILLQKHISLVAQLEECLKTIQSSPMQKIGIQKQYERIAKLEEEEERYRNLKVSLYQDFQEELLSKEDYLEIRAQYDEKIADVSMAKQQLQREIDLADEDGKNTPEWVSDFMEHKNLQCLTRAVAVECIEEIRVFEGKKLKIQFTHAQDYTQLLEHLGSFSKYELPTVKEVG